MTHPRPSQSTLPRDIETRVRDAHVRVHDVHAVLVGEGRVGALPGRDAAAAGAQLQRGPRDPAGAEAVEEICVF